MPRLCSRRIVALFPGRKLIGESASTRSCPPGGSPSHAVVASERTSNPVRARISAMIRVDWAAPLVGSNGDCPRRRRSRGAAVLMRVYPRAAKGRLVGERRNMSSHHQTKSDGFPVRSGFIRTQAVARRCQVSRPSRPRPSSVSDEDASGTLDAGGVPGV